MIATPIGNLRDISLRALDTLTAVPLLAAEDTRVARRLLAAHNIRGKKILSLRAHNENRAAVAVINGARAYGSAAYLADAGTPGVSDPGGRLVRLARAEGVRVIPIPGASALTALWSAAGIFGEVHFLGFPPRAAAARRDFFQSLTALSGYAALFEAPRRVADTVMQLREVLGDAARAVVGRELTKAFEQLVDTTVGDLAAAIAADEVPTRGEFSLLVELPGRGAGAAGDELFIALAQELPLRRAAALAAKFGGGEANNYYRRRIKGEI